MTLTTLSRMLLSAPYIHYQHRSHTHQIKLSLLPHLHAQLHNTCVFISHFLFPFQISFSSHAVAILIWGCLSKQRAINRIFVSDLSSKMLQKQLVNLLSIRQQALRLRLYVYSQNQLHWSSANERKRCPQLRSRKLGQVIIYVIHHQSVGQSGKESSFSRVSSHWSK